MSWPLWSNIKRSSYPSRFQAVNDTQHPRQASVGPQDALTQCGSVPKTSMRNEAILTTYVLKKTDPPCLRPRLFIKFLNARRFPHASRENIRLLCQHHLLAPLERDKVQTRLSSSAASVLSACMPPTAKRPSRCACFPSGIYKNQGTQDYFQLWLLRCYRRGVSTLHLTTGEQVLVPVFVIPCVIISFSLLQPARSLVARADKWSLQSSLGLQMKSQKAGVGLLSVA